MSLSNGQVSPERVALILEELKTTKIRENKIKLHEWSDLEDKVEHEVMPWIGHGLPPIWYMQGVLWLWLRRKHPQLTFEDFGEIDTEQLIEITQRNAEADVDPTSGSSEPTAAAPKPKPSRASATSGG
jgi:hypothetical protein